MIISEWNLVSSPAILFDVRISVDVLAVIAHRRHHFVEVPVPHEAVALVFVVVPLRS